jgi:hypothetical protein
MPAAAMAGTSVLSQRGFDCFGIDREPSAIAHVRASPRSGARSAADHFHAGEIESLPWDTPAWTP